MIASLIPVLIGALLTFLASAVGRVLLALGMSYVAYSGMDFAIGWLQTSVQTNLTGMPVSISGFLAWLWVDKAISMMFSTYTVAITFKLAGSTILKKLVVK